MYLHIDTIEDEHIDRVLFCELGEPSLFSSGPNHYVKTAPILHVCGPIQNWALEVRGDRCVLHTNISLLRGEAELSDIDPLFTKLTHQGWLEYWDLFQLASLFGNGDFENMQIIKRMAENVGVYLPRDINDIKTKNTNNLTSMENDDV